MISSANSPMFCCLTATLVGFLCILASTVKLGNGAVSVSKPGSDDITPTFPPQTLESPYPRLLHERDVIHYHNAQGQRVSVGSGTYADVTLGELAESKVSVVVKSFHSSPFRDILKEIRLHRYAEQLGITPFLIGLLPSGPLTGNISLVYEYVMFSKSLDDWLDNYKELSTVQWVQVCHQLALALLRLHQHGIVFNDLHRGNVLIQKSDTKLRVYIIDFGFATYKTGKVYSSNYGNFSGYSFIAPELKNGFPSTAATDIFALGYTFTKIAYKINFNHLFYLANWCLENDPNDRPLLLTVIARLDNILFGVRLQFFAQKRIRKLEYSRRDYLILSRENLAVVSEVFLVCPATYSTTSRMDTSSFKVEKATIEKVWLRRFGVFERCQVPLFVLDEHDLFQQKESEITWLSVEKYDAIRTARLKLTNQTVIVKEFYQVTFEHIREETCVTGFLGGINVSPKIIGVLIEYKKMDDIAFVQEFYGYGVSLTKFTSISSGHEWDLEFLKKTVKGDLEYQQEQPLFYATSNVHIDVLNDWIFRECKGKSYRRLIMERISRLLIQKIKLVHDAGYLLNNCRTNNILVNWKSDSDDRLDIDVRIIDLTQVSSIHKGLFMGGDFDYLSGFTYLAPEVLHGRRTSKSSDIYSLCFALYQIMQDYFSASITLFKHLTALRKREGFYSQSTSQTALNGTHVNITEDVSGLKDKDAAFHKYYLLLLQCFHGHPNERPSIKDLLSASSSAFE